MHVPLSKKIFNTTGSSGTCPYPGPLCAATLRVRVEGLSKSPHFNGLFAHIERRLEGGRYGVTLEHDGKVFSLKSVNLIIAGCPQE